MAALLWIEIARQHELGKAQDAIHRRADFVAHVREERRFGMRRPLGRIARGDKLDLQRLALSNVADRRNHAAAVVLGRAPRLHVRFEPAPTPIAMPQPIFDGRGWYPAGDDGDMRGVDGLVVVGMDELGAGASHELVGGQPRQFDAGWRDVNDRAIVTGPQHDVRRVVGEEAILEFASAQRFLRGDLLADVLNNADDADGLVAGDALRLTLHADALVGSVRHDQRGGVCVGGPLLHCGRNRRLDAIAIVGMVAVDGVLHRWYVLATDAEDGIDLIRPADLAPDQVDAPVTDAGQRGRHVGQALTVL